MPGWRVQVSQEFTPEFVSYPNLRRFMSNELRNFLALSYDELEQLNLKAKEQRQKHVAVHKIQEERIKYLTDEKRIKAVTVLFSDLEGRLHMLDYDKKFLIKSWDNLTFDGSRSEEHTSELQSLAYLVCRLLLEKKKKEQLPPHSMSRECTLPHHLYHSDT